MKNSFILEHGIIKIKVELLEKENYCLYFLGKGQNTFIKYIKILVEAYRIQGCSNTVAMAVTMMACLNWSNGSTIWNRLIQAIV